MAILSSIPVLNCRYMEKTLAFYQQLLQFVVVNKREINDELCWAHIMHGYITLMLQSVDQQHPEPGSNKNSNITLYFFVNNINELHHYIKAKYNVASEIVETDYQTFEFELTDPEGNTVTVGQKS